MSGLADGFEFGFGHGVVFVVEGPRVGRTVSGAENHYGLAVGFTHRTGRPFRSMILPKRPK